MTVKMKPLGDRILVKAIKPDTGPVIIPETVLHKEVSLYQVVKLGTNRGKCEKCKANLPFEVAVGNIVAIRAHSGVEFKIEGEEFRLMTSDEIVAVYT